MKTSHSLPSSLACGIVMLLTTGLPLPAHANLLDQVVNQAGQAVSCITAGKGLYSCLVQTFGPTGLQLCKNAVSLSMGKFSAADCDQAYQQTSRNAAGLDAALGDAAADIQNAGRDALDCAADPVGCAEKIATDLGVDDPNLGKMAILTGNVSFTTGGLLFSDFGITNVGITDIDDSKVSAACKAFIALPWSRGGVLTLTTGGSYRLVVPACGPITYTLKPSNPLFSWNPPTRRVTVGAGGGSSAAGGSNSISAAVNVQQMEATGGGGTQTIEHQNYQGARQQNSGSGGSGSGKNGRTMIYNRNSGK